MPHPVAQTLERSIRGRKVANSGKLTIGAHPKLETPNAGGLTTWAAAFLNVIACHGFGLLINRPSWESVGSGPNPQFLITYPVAVGSLALIFAACLRQPRFVRDGMLLLLVGLLPLVSAIWAPVYLGTIREAAGFTSAYFCAVATAAYFSPSGIIQVALKGGIIAVVGSLVMVLFFPDLGTGDASIDVAYEGSWRGIFGQKNELGTSMGISLLLFVMVGQGQLRFRIMRPILILAAALELVLSRSASAAIITYSILLVFGFFPRFLPSRTSVIIRILSLPGLLLALISPVFFNVSDLLSRDATLTGRVPFWAYLWSHLDHPLLLGLGYATGYQYFFWPSVYQLFGPSFPNAHNGFLDLYIGLGLLGLLVFISLIIQALASAARLRRSTNPHLSLLGRIGIMIIVMWIILSLTEATFLVVCTMFSSAILFVSAVIIKAKQEKVPQYRLAGPSLLAPANDLRSPGGGWAIRRDLT